MKKQHLTHWILSIDFWLWGTFLVLLGNLLARKIRDKAVLVEGFSTEKDSDLVTFIKYVYFFLSQIAFWLVKLPYKYIKILVRIPQQVYDAFYDAFEPIWRMFRKVYYDLRESFVMLKNAIKKVMLDFYVRVKNFPNELKKMFEDFFKMVQNFFSTLGDMMNMVYDLMNTLMEIPFKIMSSLGKLTTFMFSLPKLMMKIPDKGIDMMMNFTDQLDSMMG